MTADRSNSRAREGEIDPLGGGEAGEFEVECATVAPNASPGRAVPQGAAREVDRLLDLERIPLQIRGLDIERAKCIGQPARGEDRGIDARREGPHSLECCLNLNAQFLQLTARTRRVGVEKLPYELEREHRRSQILLNAGVQSLLDPSALPVEVGEHLERVSRRSGGGHPDRRRGQARWCGGTEERSVPFNEEALAWLTS